MGSTDRRRDAPARCGPGTPPPARAPGAVAVRRRRGVSRTRTSSFLLVPLLVPRVLSAAPSVHNERSVCKVSVMPPARGDHEARRQDVSEAVWQVLAAQGFGGLTLRAVAAEMGASTGLL